MSYGNFVRVEASGGGGDTWIRLPIGDTEGRSEAWLRDMLHAHPAIVPVADIDASYGPLTAVCTELQTAAGPIDDVFINQHGKLTLVECKLWRNAESRRKLVAQIIDYASAISKWSYSDLQRQVNARCSQSGNFLFLRVKASHPGLVEQRFIDATTNALRQGKFLLLLAGDGIREEVQQIGELLNRNAGAAYSFGMFEVALYRGPLGDLLIQPRVVARTQNIERTVVILKSGEAEAFTPDQELLQESLATPEIRSAAAGIHEAARQWWEPVLSQALEDPNQPEFKYYWPHNVRGPLPWPGTWITAYKLSGSRAGVGVFVGGREEPLAQMLSALLPMEDELRAELPVGAEISPSRISVFRPMSAFETESAAREWLSEALNQFVNAVRPRVSKLVGGSSG